MLGTFLNQTVTIMRLQTVSGSKRALATTQTADYQVQNIDTRQARVVEGIASKTYMAWFETDVDVREGDVLRDHETDKRFKVIGVEHQGQGLGLVAEHLEVTMVKYNI